MNHDEAAQLMIAEKYLLNELSPEIKEEFEDHFFGCTQCASDVRSGMAFIEQSKAALSSERYGRERELSSVRAPRTGWRNWLFRPAFALPVMALMLATIAYMSVGMRSQPQLLTAAFVNVRSRGANSPAIIVHREDGFLLRLSLPPEHEYSSYAVDVYGPARQLKWSLKLPTSIEDDNYFIEIPRGHHDEGVYTVAVRGLTSAGASSGELGRSTFELHVQP
ncbi:MAG: zf-HC2 domain-containing protein [Acidobacteria bacterium]|nr:zf-HC2 domain-containing protein [Acidobacteriota bacterium]